MNTSTQQLSQYLTVQGGASRAIADNLKFLNSYDKIVIAFDNDDAGQKATDEVCRLIGSKAHVAKLGTFKDANEMYLAGRKNRSKGSPCL